MYEINKNLSPIVLFTYNRPWHTRQTIEALQKNELAEESELFIFSDGAKNEEDENNVKEVRNYLKSIRGFKKITVIERGKNWGLASNIIDGVTKIVNKYGKIIVLEDDLVTSPYFLKFMNDALEFYNSRKKVWHISGWNYPIYNEVKSKTFLWKKMNCWGWATWSDRWAHFEKNTNKLLHEFTGRMKKEFDLDGTDSNWQQVIENKSGKLDTWAVFWHATIFINDGLCLNPYTSFVKNIGCDGSGVHCNNSKKKEIEILNNQKNIIFNTSLQENIDDINLVKKYLKSRKENILIRLLNKLSRILVHKNILK